jgi:hypothetical protein
MEFTSSIQRINEQFLPALRELEVELSRAFPDKKISLYSGPGGDGTQHQHYSVVLDCEFPDARPHDWQSIALFISLKQQTSTAAPRIGAVLMWDDGRIEAGVFEELVPVTASVIDELSAQLPQLYDTFREAIRRGHPQR